MRFCLFCGSPLPESCRPTRRYCCEDCRRQAQNERRRDERAELREVLEAGKPMDDPWSRCDLDHWTAAQIWENALLDPMP